MGRGLDHHESSSPFSPPRRTALAPKSATTLQKESNQANAAAGVLARVQGGGVKGAHENASAKSDRTSGHASNESHTRNGKRKHEGKVGRVAPGQENADARGADSAGQDQGQVRSCMCCFS